METNQRNDDEGGAGEPKLIPEWDVNADDQVLFAGLAVAAAIAVLLGWNLWRGDDEPPEAIAPVVTSVQAAGPTSILETAGDAAVFPIVPVEEEDAAEGDPEEEDAAEAQATTTTTTAPTTTTEAAPVIGDVQAAVDSFPGDITGTNAGAVAVLEGFVANQSESREAEQAAGAVEGITSVTNNLVILEPDTLAALQSADVAAAEADGIGTVMTVRGTISAEEDRAGALQAAAAVTGVSEVVDELELSVTADLNELPNVLFATNSAVILPESFDDLEAAAELLVEAGTVAIQVQGYTDIEGDEDRNLLLSQERAESVVDYLVTLGVEPDNLSAAGFGETEQFGPDFESNRLVRFQQIA